MNRYVKDSPSGKVRFIFLKDFMKGVSGQSENDTDTYHKKATWLVKCLKTYQSEMFP